MDALDVNLHSSWEPLELEYWQKDPKLFKGEEVRYVQL
jgi:hypothetical protein